MVSFESVENVGTSPRTETVTDPSPAETGTGTSRGKKFVPVPVPVTPVPAIPHGFAFPCPSLLTTHAEHDNTPSLVLFRAQILSCPLEGVC